MTNPRPNKPAWEEWQLTAFVLGELESDLADQIEAAADEDARLSAEIVSIRRTLDQVSEVYQAEAAAEGLGPRAADGGFERVLQQLAPAQQPAGNLQVARPPASRTRARTNTWMGLLAMSAAVIFAVWLYVPQVSEWMVASAKIAAVEESPSGSQLAAEELNDQSRYAATASAEPFNLSLSQQLSDEAIPAWGGFASESKDAELPTLESLAVRQKYDADMLAGTGNVKESIEAMRDVEAVQLEVQNAPLHYPTASQWNELSQRRSKNQDGAEALGGLAVGGSPSASGGPGGGPGSAAATAPVAVAASSVDGGLATVRGASPQPSASPDNPRPSAAVETDVTRFSTAGASEGYGTLQEAKSSDLAPVSSPSVATDDAFTAGDAPKSFYYREQVPEVELAKSLALSRRRYMPLPVEGSASRFEEIVENSFLRVDDAPLSTFSIDVDTASYAKSRQLLMEANRLPPPAAVRIEEFINYFDYEYAGPNGDEPFGANLAVASCPWRPEHKLVRIALQAPTIDLAQRPQANIVFLLDVSGSMSDANKLPLVKESMRMLIEQLGENDKVAMVVYAGAAGCVLESTRGDQQQKILGALDRLQAGGSTNGGDGIQLAYNLARDNFIPGGINRVILCTDGDFNVGVTSTEALVELVVENAKSKTFLTVLGYGMGNTNDAMMEQISNRGNGVYGFVDSWREAKRQMVQQLAGNLLTVAKDVKIQVEFNPHKIKSYRLLGYENRVMAAEDFNNDKIDAGEIGAGHRVTALYEVVPVGSQSEAGQPAVDELRYQRQQPPQTATNPAELAEQADDDGQLQNELLAVKLRYKQPEGDTSQLLVYPLQDENMAFGDADRDFRWAASMAEFGMLLRHSRYSGSANWSGLIEQATAAAGVSPDPLREEALQMLRRAAQLNGQ